MNGVQRVKLGMPDISMERLLKLFKGAFNTRNCLEVAKSSSSSSSSGSSGSSSARKGKDKEKDKEKKSRDRDRDRSRERDGDSDTEMDYDEKKEKDRKDSRLGSGAVSLVLTYMLPGDVELQGSFVLQEVSNAQTKTREVANMIFNLLDKKRPQPQPEGPSQPLHCCCCFAVAAVAVAVAGPDSGLQLRKSTSEWFRKTKR